MASQTSIWRHEGFFGLWKGTILALIGVSNGAVMGLEDDKLNNATSHLYPDIPTSIKRT
ncbi:hypothetical protein BDR07DRAFT_1398329 [Suillus spraguei]|nr:hypothetical protein BDR07DRAFT_1398329 [Suillus spraguei]